MRKILLRRILVVPAVGTMLAVLVGLWLFQTTSGLRSLLCAVTRAHCEIVGLQGSVARGFSFDRWDLGDSVRDLVVEDFQVSLAELWSSVWRGKPRLESLRIGKVVFVALSLEKPSQTKVRADLERVLASLNAIQLRGDGITEVQIGELAVNSASITMALGSSPVFSGSVRIRGFSLSSTGWSAMEFVADSEQVRLKYDASSGVSAKVNLAPDVFSDAISPLAFEEP